MICASDEAPATVRPGQRRPGVGEALAAVVAREDDDRVAGEAQPLQRAEHAPDLLIHPLDHRGIGRLGTAVEILHLLDGRGAFEALRFRRVGGALPRPMRRAEVEAEQERPVEAGESLERADRMVAQQVGQIARLMQRRVAIPQVGMIRHGVGEIIDRAAAEPPEMLISAFERSEARQGPEMPLADEPGFIAGVAQERRKSGVRRRDPDIAARDRLLETDREAILVAAGDQRRARRRTNRAVGIGLSEPQSFGGQAIDVRRSKVRPAVAGQVGIAEVVGHDEQDVGPGPRLRGERARQRRGGCRGTGKHRPTRQADCHDTRPQRAGS